MIALIAACSSQAPQADENLANAVVVDNVATPVDQAAQPAPAPGTAAGLPDDRTPLAEPKGSIDPKSAEGAGQVVQHYAALIEQKRFNEAAELWEDPKAAAKLSGKLRGLGEVHAEVGKPGGMEGAAGSSYISVPVALYGKTAAGAPFNCRTDATLRRVNDVPGSTPRQREWHIYRLEC